MNPFKDEIEKILTAHPRTRIAKVLIGMRRGLTDAEMAREAEAAGEPVRADTIAAVRRIINLTFDDQLIPARSDAAYQANLYRELLNYRRSPELHQDVMTRLTQLHALDPNIPLTRLGDVRLGRNPQPQSPNDPGKCPMCNTVHAGDCWRKAPLGA